MCMTNHNVGLGTRLQFFTVPLVDIRYSTKLCLEDQTILDPS